MVRPQINIYLKPTKFKFVQAKPLRKGAEIRLICLSLLIFTLLFEDGFQKLLVKSTTSKNMADHVRRAGFDSVESWRGDITD